MQSFEIRLTRKHHKKNGDILTYCIQNPNGSDFEMKRKRAVGLPTFKCHFISFSDRFNAKIRPVIVETYIVPSINTGEDTLGPTSLTHKSEGLRGILEADTPVRIALPRNIFHESLSDTPNVCFPINNVNSRYPKKNLYYYISYLLACLFCGLLSWNI